MSLVINYVFTRPALSYALIKITFCMPMLQVLSRKDSKGKRGCNAGGLYKHLSIVSFLFNRVVNSNTLDNKGNGIGY